MPKKKTEVKKHELQLMISGQELYFWKIRQTYETMVNKEQSELISRLTQQLYSTDMMLRPE